MWTNLEALPPAKYFFNFKDAMRQNVCTENGSNHPEPTRQQHQPSSSQQGALYQNFPSFLSRSTKLPPTTTIISPQSLQPGVNRLGASEGPFSLQRFQLVEHTHSFRFLRLFVESLSAGLAL